ncbi:MAG: hypothetical protein ACI9OD_000877 [Limisphaerales bacterium]|jgi:hypothetical protein
MPADCISTVIHAGRNHLGGHEAGWKTLSRSLRSTRILQGRGEHRSILNRRQACWRNTRIDGDAKVIDNADKGCDKGDVINFKPARPTGTDGVTVRCEKNCEHFAVSVSSSPVTRRIQTAFSLVIALCAFSSSLLAKGQGVVTIPEGVTAVLDRYCLSCHDIDSEKGDIRIDNLTDVPLGGRLALLNKMHEQLYLGEMPPKKKKAQPSEVERQRLIDWVSGELKKHGGSKLDDKLRYPEFGNYVSHEKLFSGEIKDAPFTPARRWLVSPQIFEERVRDVFELSGRQRQRALPGITIPFMLPERSGVRDYDNSTLDGGHLLVMLPNAEWISYRQIRDARVKSGEQNAKEFPNAKDRWVPPTPAAFESVILKKAAPSDEEISAAIQQQFALVLQREPDEAEVQKYLELTRSSIDLAGNSEGLRQMLVSVLLESEFLYRLEFGVGKADEHGRRMLSPHEGARAISYALGDRGPGEALRQAAAKGRLETREDYRREVKRLLADQNYYAGPVDKGISGKNMKSHETSHPKLVRFFREFFGYPHAAKIFKDIERSDGYYQNPGRDTLGTPGFLIKEADRVVDWYLKHDQAVFENLLTTEEFFVYHNKDNVTGRQLIAEWGQVWEKLKDTDWQDNPAIVYAANEDFLNRKSLWIFRNRYGSERKKPGQKVELFSNHMHYFRESFGRGRTPFTTVPFSHGYQYHHATFYNLLPTPTRGRYQDMFRGRFKGPEGMEFWDYPVEQPFKLVNRKGILTHPAWLIAHSSNFHTDPIKRGRWIREKLLAGRVPDVPITVDAQIPEDPHMTLRERVEGVTHEAECWKCHQHMNPLGFAFENYDDFGRHQLAEPLEYKENLIAKAKKKDGANTYRTKAINSTGRLDGTGDPNLDGEVTDALDMIDRLAKSGRVRQSILRHAFRFFMGRNEILSDSRTLIAADQAYLKSGGSFKAVVVSHLTSDSFIYRKPIPE